MVTCPICGSKFQNFEPFRMRENARCGSCRALERHRLLWIFLTTKTDLLLSNYKLLHFGPEKSFFKIFANTNSIDYYPCDLHPEKYNYGDKIVCKVDIAQIPYPNSYFDAVLCSQVLQFVRDDTAAISEIYRVLASTGWCVFQVPMNGKGKTKPLTSKTSLRPLTDDMELRVYRTDFKEKLMQAGFEVCNQRSRDLVSSSAVRRWGLRHDESLFYCLKR